jgi:CarD family transcriptional regulator
MQYIVGENVVHPAHGAGEIIATEEQESTDESSQYCVIFFPDRKLKIRIPLSRIEDVGLRSVMSLSTYRQILEVLAEAPELLPQDFKERREMLQAIVSSGSPIKVAAVIRDLNWRSHNKPLNRSDAEMLSEARHRLVQEMALATGKEIPDINAVVDRALQVSVEAGEQAEKQAEEQAEKQAVIDS